MYVLIFCGEVCPKLFCYFLQICLSGSGFFEGRRGTLISAKYCILQLLIPALVELPYEFESVCHNQRSQNWLVRFFFFHFLHEVRQPLSKKSDEVQFLKSLVRSEDPKKSQQGPKNEVFRVLKKSYPFICTFFT